MSAAPFEYGSQWLRADFHLHTKADKEFTFAGDANFFVSDYVARLKTEEIGVAAITNHNKFDADEYREIRRMAGRESIFVLPGVELSVAEGANGIHCLLVFDPATWLDGSDYINRFLDQAFGLHVRDRENENARCDYNLATLFKKLSEQKSYGRESFVIMAHIEDRSGFCEELEGGRITEIGQDPQFKEFVLGLQKARTRNDLKNCKDWLGTLPALVEGSDPKAMEEVGRAHQVGGNPQKTYIKIGDHNFQAVQYAMKAYGLRVRSAKPARTTPFVRSMTITSGTKQPLTVRFNEGLNTLIGIRGSGKSTLIEILRYALDVMAEKEAQDAEYKAQLLQAHLGSGGKVSIDIVANGIVYQVERVLNDAKPKVRRDGQLVPNLLPSAIIKVAYFGQKDLAQIGQVQTSRTILERFFPHATKDADLVVKDLAEQVSEKVREQQLLEKALQNKKEVEEEKARLDNNARGYQQNNVTQKLQRQLEFSRDDEHAKAVAQWLEAYRGNLDAILKADGDALNELLAYQSKENADILSTIRPNLEARAKFIQGLETELSAISKLMAEFQAMQSRLAERRGALEDEFASIRRAIAVPLVNADSVLKEQQRLDQLNKALTELDRKQEALNTKRTELLKSLDELQTAWLEQFKALNASISEVNQKNLSITLKLEYRGDRGAFIDFLRKLVEGTGIQRRTLEGLAEKFADPVELYRDLASSTPEAEKIFGSPQSWGNFYQRVTQNLSAFLNYRVPDVLSLLYNNIPLERHSLGQRATALILFLLGRSDQHLLIIDQPEDDLDNRSLFEDVIKRLWQAKEATQFLFATHNPNIPVLGEAEQVQACAFNASTNTISTHAGSIDGHDTQAKIINIMEGGRDAFTRRKGIYEHWKH
ncbi:MAG: AAA family ATPase [Opitutaceae bacterium]|nr:AAA family ATPase [Opitutaceae bacterium]